MNTYRNRSNAQACGAQVASEASTQSQYQQIKLAPDVHAASLVVVRMMDGAKKTISWPDHKRKSADLRRPHFVRHMIEITFHQHQTQRTLPDWPRSKKLKHWCARRRRA
jgi:5-deoxy-D-glucuronate isomerase